MATSLNNMDLKAVENALENYYFSSVTAGRGEYIQGTIFSRGKGLGSIIKAVMKAAAPIARKVGHALKPIAKKAGKYMLNRGVETAADIAADISSGVTPEKAFRQNAERAFENAKFDALHGVKTFIRKPGKVGPKTRKRKGSTKNGPRVKKYTKRSNF
jgi:hypothetical protein